METNAGVADDNTRKELKPWLSEIGRSRAFWYDLDDASKPRHVRLGTRIVVLESPRAWLERMRVAGGAVTKRREAAA